MRKKLLFLFLIFIYSTTFFAQEINDIKKKVIETDSLYSHHILSSKEYPDRTVWGSLTAYYYTNKLILIKTLTDAEYGGTETFYYVDSLTLIKSFEMRATFKDPNEWTKYYHLHEKDVGCMTCHHKRHCKKTIITFTKTKQFEKFIANKPSIVSTEDKEVQIKYIEDSFNLLLAFIKTF